MRNNKLWTKELQNVWCYMTDILVNEFPSKEYTLEHLIVSLLDNSNTHAYMILDNCLMSQNLQQLRDIYVNYLQSQANVSSEINGMSQLKGDMKVSEELECIMSNSDNERHKISSKLIGTEHVLLSMLSNETNIGRIQEVFKTVGIDYNFIKNKCSESNIQKTTPNKINNHMKPNFVLPLKSEINTKGITNKTNYIQQYTINITKQAREGKIDNLIGRDSELSQVIRTLARRKKNNVVLVGKGGVGKTAIVDGFAKLIVENKVPEFLRNKEIVKLNVVALVSGTHFRGMFEERVNGLFSELKSSKNYILFIDDMQTVLKSGTKEKDTDLSSMISDILNENEVQVIGAVNFKDYRNAIESNTSISRKLQKIIIEPTSVEETIDILKQNKLYYEEYHHVLYSDNIIKSCVNLANRYITDRCLPDSAFDILDLTGANVCFQQNEPNDISFAKNRLLDINNERSKYMNDGDFEYVDKLTQEENTLKLLISNYNRERNDNRTILSEEDVANVVSHMTKIPVNKLTINEKAKIANIENILKESVIGQDEAIESVCRIIKRNKVGLSNNSRTLGNLLLAGNSGVGKTLIAKKLAEEIFGDEKALIRIDMSEYSEKNSVSKLTGAAPGYIGFENGGQLTEAVKNKQHCVLLLDEIEKADQEVYNLFLQLFDEGRLTDSSGQIVNFKNVIVLMTSNIGAKKAAEFGGGIGFTSDAESNKKSIIEKELKKKFTPEFLNRIDQIVYFNPLTNDNLYNIVNLELKKFKTRIQNIEFDIIWDENVTRFITDKAIAEKEYGARPILRLIQTLIEDEITNLILINEYPKNYIFKIKNENERITIE